jgi:hypothetical protein
MGKFMVAHPGAMAIPAGSLGGLAACVKTADANGPEVQCVWFDNDTVGEFTSVTMTATDLSNAAMTTFRPAVELVAK